MLHFLGVFILLGGAFSAAIGTRYFITVVDTHGHGGEKGQTFLLEREFFINPPFEFGGKSRFFNENRIFPLFGRAKKILEK